LLEPSFGAFNLQDIKAPECFYIEERLQEHMDVPVMHNNQHSTACVITATLINACDVSKKDMKNIQVVVCGAGASGYSIARLLPEFGIPRENIVAVDSTGVIYDGRWAGMNKYKERIAIDTKKRTLKDVVKGSDVFIGVSTKDLLTPLMLQSMNENPIVFAMSTPEPEINVDLAKSTRADVIIATGRSDYPNQILDTMVFPFFFRGALDVGAKTFNLEMKKAVIESLVRIARMEVPDHVKGAYGRPDMVYGRDYLIPTAFDHRLLVEVSYAVARAAHDSGNSTKPYDNWDNYKKALQERVDEKVKEIKAKVDKAKERFDSVLKFIRSNTVDIK
jgi:malate dehydrogenase (oxaloacetate-decarboxylating)(NADP+)